MKEANIKKINQTKKEESYLYEKKINRSLHIYSAAATAGTLIATGKLTMSIASSSVMICVNALYSFGMIGAKIIALTGIRKAQHSKEQCQYYFWTGLVLVISSLIYISYSIRLFYSPVSNAYHPYVGIGIAAVTFTEVGVNIRGVMITRHNHTLLIHALKMINLSSSIIALALTQSALLSFSNYKADLIKISNANGVIGILMGAITTLMGIYMICRVRKNNIQSHFTLQD